MFLASHWSGFPASLEPILGLVVEPQLGSSAPGLKIISKSTAKPGFSHEIPRGSHGFLSSVPCTKSIEASVRLMMFMNPWQFGQCEGMIRWHAQGGWIFGCLLLRANSLR